MPRMEKNQTDSPRFGESSCSFLVALIADSSRTRLYLYRDSSVSNVIIFQVTLARRSFRPTNAPDHARDYELAEISAIEWKTMERK